MCVHPFPVKDSLTGIPTVTVEQPIWQFMTQFFDEAKKGLFAHNFVFRLVEVVIARCGANQEGIPGERTAGVPEIGHLELLLVFVSTSYGFSLSIFLKFHLIFCVCFVMQRFECWGIWELSCNSSFIYAIALFFLRIETNSPLST
jgi:hypothetical protein